MQSKGAIRVFAIAFALVCLFQLSFTFISSKVGRDAARYSKNEVARAEAQRLAQGSPLLETFYLDSIVDSRESYYLDSMTNQVVFNILVKKYTYREVKEREINLGLDLKGGMNVVLEVSMGDIIKALAGPNSVNPIFQEALSRSYQKQRESERDFVTLFGDSFKEVDPNAKLASIFNTVELKEKVSYNSTNEEVLEVIRDEANSAFDRTYNILRTRIDRFGVTQPNIQKLSGSGRILVELPGIKDPGRVRKLLQGTARLEFWETYQYPEIYNYFIDANTRLKDLEKKESSSAAVTAAGETEPGTLDDAGEISSAEDTAASSLLDQLDKDTSASTGDRTFEDYAEENPLNAYLAPAFFQGQDGNYYPGEGATVGYAQIKDTARVNAMLKKVDNVFPRNMRLVWTNKPRTAESNVLELVALKITSRDGSPALGGDVIVDARQDYDQIGEVEVTLTMNNEGARVWKRITGENIGKQIAIVLDQYVYSFPSVRSEIPNGRSSISGGGMTIEEAQDLANILKAGKLPAPARIIEEAVVGPSLGQEAITAGLWSFVIAFAVVLIYMVFFYARAGWIADVALLVNMFFIMGVLASLGAVLTMPGIAGIVLTLGMAVDANVIIYERIREELRGGKGIRLAISDGYKNAYSAIIDGNVTTLLTGVVLYIFGTGPVQGFATTLIIGILSSLFSAIFISRIIFTNLLDKNKSITFDYPLNRTFLQNTKIDFIGIRKYAYIFSIGIIIIGFASLAIRGLDFGVDFSGGRTYVVRFDQPVKTMDIRQALTDNFGGEAPEVKTFGPSTQVKITTKHMIDDEGVEVDSILQHKIYDGVKDMFIKPVTFDEFTTANTLEAKLVGIQSSQKVGPTIADDIRNKAIMAVAFSLIAIFIYIAIRFKRWQFGIGGLASLFHDTVFTVGLYSLFYTIMPFSMEVDQSFIAAILTIIGYSINDTVIIFDRIRENLNLHPKRDMKMNMNSAMNSTLSRTVNTSGTTLIVLLTIFIFGGEIIQGFVFALMMGIGVGTYSSLFVATPIAYDMIQSRRKRAPIKQ